MNLVVMLHTTRMNPLQTNMSKEDSSHRKQITWLHSHNNSHRPMKAAKRTPSSMDQGMTEKGVPRGHPSGPTGNKPQGPAPTAPTTLAGRPSQAPPATNPDTNHQDPLEHNDTNGSTKAPTNGKGHGATKSKKASAKYRSCYSAF